MKKTIALIATIAACALSAQAATPDEMQTTLSDLLTTANYKAGDDFTLQLSFTPSVGSSATGPLVNFGNNYHLISQVSKYLGFSINNSCNGWADKTTENGVNTITMTASDSKWVSYSSSGSSSAFDLTGTEVLFSYDAGAQTLNAKIGIPAGNVVEDVTITGLALNASDISFANMDGTVTNFTSTSKTPEPATATLSLLALAGLAARRRRK